MWALTDRLVTGTCYVVCLQKAHTHEAKGQEAE